MKNKYSIYIVGAFACSLMCVTAIAESIVGKTSKGRSTIQYTVDSKSGNYSLDLSEAFHFTIQMDKEESNGVSCSREYEIVKKLTGKLPNHSYRTGRTPITLTLSASDLNLNTTKIKNEINENLISKGLSVPNLKSTTKFFITDLNIKFEWSEDALTKKANSKLSIEAREIFENYKNSNQIGNLHASGKSDIIMPFHTVICDLQSGKLKLLVSAMIEIVNDNKKEPLLTKKQLLNLNNELVSNTGILSKSILSGNDNFSPDIKKIIHSSALLAFGLAKQGFDFGSLKSKYFEAVLYRMFNSSTLYPKKLSDPDLEELQSILTEEVRTQDDPISIFDNELKIEVAK